MSVQLLPLLFLFCPATIALLAWLRRNSVSHLQKQQHDHASTLIVLGSGGHTAQMLKLVSELDMQFYRPRVYVIADTDSLSPPKALAFEKQSSNGHEAKIVTIKRSRESQQSFFTAIFTTTKACLDALLVVWMHRPALVLLNGPGTCIPICLSVRLCTLLGIYASKIVYLESIARVDSLSLSGKIIYYLRMADLFMVQWPNLVKQYPRAQHASRVF